jgi:hypothetical protein
MRKGVKSIQNLFFQKKQFFIFRKFSGLFILHLFYKKELRKNQ